MPDFRSGALAQTFGSSTVSDFPSSVFNCELTVHVWSQEGSGKSSKRKLDDRSLQEIPTWAVALVCAVFIIISISIEHGIVSLGKLFHKRQKKAMTEALEKMKAELTILGFISLLLSVSTTYVVKICIPIKLGKTLLPCQHYKEKSGLFDDKGENEGGDRRKLLSYAEGMMWHRSLVARDEHEDYCAAKGRISLISYKGIHQLHMCIFVLVVFHILYSVILMALGQAKMMKWKAWESETSSLEYQVTIDPRRLRFTHQTTFVKRHVGFSRKPLIRWIVAFFRQFLGSISKADYLAIRGGFINAHFAPNSKFNFHKYIRRSMEDDYKKVLGIRCLSFSNLNTRKCWE
ncbi:Seven transmembrane MLO family protein [Heracleum sosnowskyi]|uniref:Seven transmembrane MLO family protein n=1 Tax=Heracleum sosnowskyi TaxID=360622 RepID=A0AAD8JBL2_9APIA|nr:Seven transmembrane MLO family protein [Heracleum sosnowskyi]